MSLVLREELAHRSALLNVQSELAKFILAEVLEKDGVFSITQSMKYKDQYGPELLAKLL